ncbi:MAG TPA: hypothetical protein PKI94_01405 [Candidatus Gastranaerophilaceae bacterium]|nr:hypothetical protein [Candidatus Gastranaerophilaceae bacterium]
MQINRVSNSTSFDGRLLIPSHKKAGEMVKYTERGLRALLGDNVCKYDCQEYLSSLNNLLRIVKKESKNFILSLYPVPENGNVRFIFSQDAKFSKVVEQPANDLKIVGEEIAVKYKTIMQDPKQFSELA